MRSVEEPAKNHIHGVVGSGAWKGWLGRVAVLQAKSDAVDAAALGRKEGGIGSQPRKSLHGEKSVVHKL